MLTDPSPAANAKVYIQNACSPYFMHKAAENQLQGPVAVVPDVLAEHAARAVITNFASLPNPQAAEILPLFVS